MNNKSKLFLLLTLATTLFSSAQIEQDSNALINIGQLEIFMEVFRTYNEEVFKEIIHIYNSEMPQELKHDILMLLSFDKRAILELFGPRAETLAQNLAKFTKCKTLSYFRKRYLSRIIFLENFDLLAEIIDFGLKNGFKFEPQQLSNYNVLNFLPYKAITQETASKIINNLSYLINAQDQYGFSCLMDAVHAGRLDLAKLFIDAKANLEIKSTEYFQSNLRHDVAIGRTALDIAVLHNYLDLFRLLLYSGAYYKLSMLEGNENIASMVKEFLAQQKKLINSALHDELPQVLVNIVCEYLEDKPKTLK